MIYFDKQQKYKHEVVNEFESNGEPFIIIR